MAEEKFTYMDVEEVNNLPKIFDYWSNKYLRPMLEEFGFSNPDEFFAKYLRDSATACGDASLLFLSIGSGNCETEVHTAQLMRSSGLENFTIECLDMNQHMLARGQQTALREGVADFLIFVEADFNSWRATKKYSGIMANQSLHHVVNLEELFDEVRKSLRPNAYFIASDIIGRNGHQRWPEALKEVHRFWQELPTPYRYNQQLKRQESMYENWDCSHEAFEGIRSQDILPLLLERFHFHVYIGFSNIIDVFIDRSFGGNFNPDQEWDRIFVDRVHAFDEKALLSGQLTPTHMMAVLTAQPMSSRFYARGLSPERSVRKVRRWMNNR